MSFWVQDNWSNALWVVLILLLILQIYILIRIRSVLKSIAQSLETLAGLFHKSASAQLKEKDPETLPPICQFCKHRLAYIYNNKRSNQIEDLYYKCGLKNIPISLTDSCESFELDDMYLE